MNNILKTLEENAREREGRDLQERRAQLARQLEPFVLGYLVRKQYRTQLSKIKKAANFYDFKDLERSNKPLFTNEQVLQKAPAWIAAQPGQQVDVIKLCCVCRHLIVSLDSPSRETNFAASFLNKTTIAEASRLVGVIVGHIPHLIGQMRGATALEVKSWQCLVHFLIVFSSSSTWSLVKQSPQIQQVLNGLCTKMTSGLYEKAAYTRMAEDVEYQDLVKKSLFVACNDTTPLISSEALNAQYSLLLRPFRGVDDDVEVCAFFDVFLNEVLTCPALLVHLNPKTQESVRSLNLLGRALVVLRADPEMLETRMELLKTMNFLGNLIHMGYLDDQTMGEHVVEWTFAIGVALTRCTEHAIRRVRDSNHQNWHPIFGLYQVALDKGTEGSLKNVLQQLKMLWSKKVISCLFDRALDGISVSSDQGNGKSTGQSTANVAHHKDLGAAFTKLWRKLGGTLATDALQATGGGGKTVPNLCDQPPTLVAVISQLFVSLLSNICHLRGEIISGICRDDAMLRKLWQYLRQWGARVAAQQSSSIFAVNLDQYGPLTAALQSIGRPKSPHTATLRLFASATTSIVSILDEEEMFEKGVPFPTRDLEAIARFTNIFCFRAIWGGYVDQQTATEEGVFPAMHGLCMLLYERDSRRSFVTDPKCWLVTDVKTSQIMSEYEKRTARGVLLMQRMPHLAPIKERMLLFRRQVADDKASLDQGMFTWVTVLRSRIIEDGFRQLSRLSEPALKSTIRVKFVNAQGLDEAGIDQDGVFKEFLELTIKKVFDPQLDLFTTTPTGVMYPSSTSSVHEEHLALFQFIGRMLAKAIYEGIVVDIQLAPALLAAVLNGHRLCAFDELSQLDPELYRSLTFIKRYEGDTADLALTFSADEDFMGKVTTVDLVPGGRTIPVTNENKIDYVHRMAHHRVFKRTHAQCRAFVAGMQSLLDARWLSLFAPHDLQCLISGQNANGGDIDLADLKKHVQYFGGFHSSHRLIKWLWDILENKFTSDERRLFLKFVTSCSRPPLLGFSYLEPPFSIRCVEVSDDQDQGDTLASVVRGFLALRKGTAASRLPTASTCFNLLKLPNYNKKSLLLEKLRYAIHAETGFELS